MLAATSNKSGISVLPMSGSSSEEYSPPKKASVTDSPADKARLLKISTMEELFKLSLHEKIKQISNPIDRIHVDEMVAILIRENLKDNGNSLLLYVLEHFSIDEILSWIHLYEGKSSSERPLDDSLSQEAKDILKSINTNQNDGKWTFLQDRVRSVLYTDSISHQVKKENSLILSFSGLS